MGTWGNGLYQNDTALDVKDTFEELFGKNKNIYEVTDEISREFDDLMGIINEEPYFWLALADTQWDYGVLLPLVKDKAFFWIEKIINSFHCRISNDRYELEKMRWLYELKSKLDSPQPKKKNPIKKKIYRCQWSIGDVFAYRLESDLAKEKGLYGRYFLIRKVDEDLWYPGHIVPIVYIKITKDAGLPSSIEEYNQQEYVQTWFTRYEDRFFPIDARRPQEDIAEKSLKSYQVDDYGFLPQYRIKLLNISKGSIPTSLIYLGNFANAIPPQKEFIPHSKENIVYVSWKQFNETFETKIIKRYCEHNRRELSIYYD